MRTRLQDAYQGSTSAHETRTFRASHPLGNAELDRLHERIVSGFKVDSMKIIPKMIELFKDCDTSTEIKDKAFDILSALWNDDDILQDSIRENSNIFSFLVDTMSERKNSLIFLSRIALILPYEVEKVHANVIHDLIRLVDVTPTANDTEQWLKQSYAILTLLRISHRNETRVRIRDQNSIGPLLNVVKNGTPLGIRAALILLTRIATTGSTGRHMIIEKAGHFVIKTALDKATKKQNKRIAKEENKRIADLSRMALRHLCINPSTSAKKHLCGMQFKDFISRNVDTIEFRPG